MTTTSKKLVVDGKGTDNAKDKDAWDQDGIGDTGNLGKESEPTRPYGQHKELNKDKSTKESIRHVCILCKELRSGLKPLNDEPAHEDSCNALARDAQSEGRDEGNRPVTALLAASEPAIPSMEP